MSFYTDFIEKDIRFNSTKRIAALDMLEPTFRKQIVKVLLKGNELGYNLCVYETYRSRQRQELLFFQGVTQLKEVGVHHFGLACDIVRIVNNQYSWAGLSCLENLAGSNNLIWGGDWGTPGVLNAFRDEAHLQRCTVFRQNSLFSLSWFPDKDYNPVEDQKTQQSYEC